jgi:hypothetical protein
MGKQHSECALCGKTIVDSESSILNEVIGGISYNFDTNQCVMMYKRFRSVYGDDFKFLAPQALCIRQFYQETVSDLERAETELWVFDFMI